MKKFIVLSIVLLMLAGFAITSSACVKAIDIKPESCPNPLNVKSKGVLTVAILGTEKFDVTKINPDSITLWLEEDTGEGVAPLRWALEDVATPYEDLIDVNETDCSLCTTEGFDGYTDLVLKFNTKAVVKEIGEVRDGDCLVLTLTWRLFDGPGLYHGYDVIIIIKKGK